MVGVVGWDLEAWEGSLREVLTARNLLGGAHCRATEWFTKGYSVFSSFNEEEFYFPALGLSKSIAMKDKSDVLGQTLLSENFSHVSWEQVASAIPPIRSAAGARGIVGSRGSSVDTTFGDTGEDAAGYGFPPALNYVFNLTNLAQVGGAALAIAPL